MLNVGVGVVVNGQLLIGTAKWADIFKMYEIDKQNVLYHLLHNVMTETCNLLHSMP